jgi:hypothetical protein
MFSIGKDFFEGPDPIDLTNVNDLLREPYMVGPKMDGKRFIMYHDSTKPPGYKTYLVNRKGEKFQYRSEDLEKEQCLYNSVTNQLEKTGKRVFRKKLPMPTTLANKFAIDVEKINDELFYILDLLEIDNLDLREQPFSFRYELLSGSFFHVGNDKCCFFPLEYIPWFPSINLHTILQTYRNIDGIVFYPKNGNYMKTKLRYKFEDTIDFEAGKNNSLKVLVGRGDFQRTEAFHQWKNAYAFTNDYIKEGNIYECRFDLKTQQWHVVNQRHDKVKPNKVQVARFIFFNVILKKRYIKPFQ